VDDGRQGESAGSELVADPQWAAPGRLIVEVVSAIRSKVRGSFATTSSMQGCFVSMRRGRRRVSFAARGLAPDLEERYTQPCRAWVVMSMVLVALNELGPGSV
jgi:hypothetical protein